jgi:hypothetical protein
MSVIELAKAELAAINFGEQGTKVMVEILEKFFEEWDSGGAVHAVAPILMRCIAAKPLSPLTGTDDEWYDPVGNGIMQQNKRCSSVFKDWRTEDGYLSDKAGEGKLTIHDIDNPTWDGTFPYWSDRAEVSSPVIEIDTSGN